MPDQPKKDASVQRRRAVPPGLRFLRWLFRFLGPAAPRLMGRFAFWLWFRPGKRREKPDEASLLDSATPVPLIRQKARLATYTWGKGPTVLLVHGWNSSTAQLTHLVGPLVSLGYRVVALDAPAHGRSAGRRTDVYEIEKAIIEVGRRVRAVEAVVSHSIGVLATARAMQSGGLVARRVVAIAPAVDRISLVDGFVRVLRLPPSVAADMGSRVDRFTGGRKFWNEAIITTPALVVYDPEDTFVPVGAVKALEDRWPHVQLLAATAAGHSGILTAPEVIAASLRFVQNGAPD